MKAVRLIAPGRPLETCDIPAPRPASGEVLVRVKAAGICHSDAHYRAGRSRVEPLPLTLGHEVAGVVEQGSAGLRPGDRVCVHYLATCGHCDWCDRGQEQFCTTGKMIGKHRDGGYAEFIAVPARSLFRLPDEIPFAHGAVIMCSSAASLHALVKARLKPGETVAVFGCGGLGASAIQLARALGAGEVFGVDLHPAKLSLAAQLGARPVDARTADAATQLLDLTGGRGVDVALEFVGVPATVEAAVRALAIQGRVAVVGIGEQPARISPYEQLINKEAEIIGVSDHLAQEILLLLRFAREGQLRLADVVTRTVPLDAKAINETLDALERGGETVRAVITP
jgi:D-arabinose 1-dehydrogenase-like Zn-dependent alcohol dehydrogenase